MEFLQTHSLEFRRHSPCLAQVRDALAYLQLLAHPSDDFALERIVNVPPRSSRVACRNARNKNAEETSECVCG